jgi:hypothetical protein
MAITCPSCGHEYDATLFEFGRGVRCDCGAWVEMERGHVVRVRPRKEPEEDAELRTGPG